MTTKKRIEKLEAIKANEDRAVLIPGVFVEGVDDDAIVKRVFAKTGVVDTILTEEEYEEIRTKDNYIDLDVKFV